MKITCQLYFVGLLQKYGYSGFLKLCHGECVSGLHLDVIRTRTCCVFIVVYVAGACCETKAHFPLIFAHTVMAPNSVRSSIASSSAVI